MKGLASPPCQHMGSLASTNFLLVFRWRGVVSPYLQHERPILAAGGIRAAGRGSAARCLSERGIFPRRHRRLPPEGFICLPGDSFTGRG